MDNDYISKMKKMYTVDLGVVDDLNWFLVLAGAAGTILCVLALAYWLIRFLRSCYPPAGGKEPEGYNLLEADGGSAGADSVIHDRLGIYPAVTVL